MLLDFVFRGVHVHTIHPASHVDHEQRVAWTMKKEFLFLLLENKNASQSDCILLSYSFVIKLLRENLFLMLGSIIM